MWDQLSSWSGSQNQECCFTTGSQQDCKVSHHGLCYKTGSDVDWFDHQIRGLRWLEIGPHCYWTESASWGGGKRSLLGMQLGCSCSMNSEKILQKANWMGENHMGHLLMKIRTDFQQKGLWTLNFDTVADQTRNSPKWSVVRWWKIVMKFHLCVVYTLINGMSATNPCWVIIFEYIIWLSQGIWKIWYNHWNLWSKGAATVMSVPKMLSGQVLVEKVQLFFPKYYAENSFENWPCHHKWEHKG